MRNLKKGENDFATLFPLVAEEWDTEQNDLSPSEVTAYCHYKAKWICRKCGYHWLAAVSSRSKGQGCPACAGQVVVPGRNDLESRFPNIAAEWDYEQNAPLTPSTISYK